MHHRIRTLVVFAVSIALMAFFLRNVDMATVVNTIAVARRDFLFLALLMVTLSYFFRAIRWRYLLEPLGHVGLGNAVRATMIGFAVSSVLPGRVGEFLRPYVLARREQLSASAVFATVVVERILDLVAILVLFSVSVVIFDPAFVVTNDALLEALRAGAAIAAVGAAGALTITYFAAKNPRRVGRIVGGAVGLLSERMSKVLTVIAERFAAGLGVMRQTAPLMLALAWSVALWVTIGTGLWLVSVSFGIQMPPVGAGVLLVLVAVGVAVPTPAGIGGYHAAYQVGVIGLYAATDEAAVGAGLLSHAMSFLPVTVIGLALMAQEGLRLSRITDLVGSGKVGRTVSNDVSVVAAEAATDGNEGRIG